MSSELKNTRILLIEDNRIDQNIIQQLLDHTDYTSRGLIITDNLADGFEALLKNSFDIILLDFFLPDSTGIESLKQLKAKYPHIPVVLITGYDSKETALKLIDAGAQDYLIKNLFNEELLQKTITYAIHRHKISSELVKLNSRLDRTLYMVSHDLHSPVKNIGVLLELLQVYNDPNDKAGLLDHLSSSVRRLEEIIASLNEVLIVKNTPSLFEVVNLEVTTMEVLNSLEQVINRCEANFNINFESCDEIYGSKSEIFSLIHHLVYNALKYSKSDTAPNIEIYSKIEDEYICIVVEDNGIGIDKKYHERIFQLFYQNDIHMDGNGIGLNIVKSIAENYGGRVTVESSPDNGAMFTVYLSSTKCGTDENFVMAI